MILQNDFRRLWEDTREDAMAAFRAVGEGGLYILGPEVAKFERELASYWGLKHAIGVGSGLDAIEISLRVLGCRPGDKAVTTPISAFATTLAIVKAGATPVFADTDQFGLLDLSAVRETLARDPLIRFVVPVHLYGHALDLENLAALQEDFKISIVEDCAQSIGSASNGRVTGSVGRMSATSFYPTKNLGAMGDGGAILTDDDQCAAEAKRFRDYGQSSKYSHDVIGFNSRLDELQAALLRRVSMPRLNRWIDRRRQVAAEYRSRIENGAVRIAGAPEHSDSSWHLFPVSVAPERKSSFMSELRQRDILTAEHYPVAIPDQKALAEVTPRLGTDLIERARLFCRSEVSLPIHPYLTDEEVSTVIDAVNAWAG